MVAEENDTGIQSEAAWHLEQAYASEENRNFEKALSECDLAIQFAPDQAEAHNLRGVILDDLGRTEEAIAAYCEAVRLDPALSEARENLLEAEREQQMRAAQQTNIERRIEPGFYQQRCASPKHTPSRREKMIDFAIGFVGWYVSSSVLWSMTSPVSPLQLLALLCLPLHIVVLNVLGIKRRWMALGVLAAFAINLTIATLLGMFFPAWCGAPFTVWSQYH